MALKGIDWQIAPWNKLYKTEFLRKNNIYFKHKLFEDTFFNFQIRVQAQNICCTSKNTLFYVAREKSLTALSLKDPNIDTIKNYAAIVNDMGKFTSGCTEAVGIYDFYLLSVRNIFNCINMRRYSKKQLIIFNTSIQGYMDVIPSIKVLTSNTHKILYLLRKLSPNHAIFLKIYSFIEKCRSLKKL